MNQESLFLESEGDAWFNRNRSANNEKKVHDLPDVRYLCDSLRSFSDQIGNVLEIGCSSGTKLEVICNTLGARGRGVDPSEQAVAVGNDRLARNEAQDIQLVQGTGKSLPFSSGSFDFVYFAFCLYLFDRSTLIQSLAEADRVLKPGGFLVLTDFDPGSPRKRNYTHLDGIYSYKQNYAEFYTGTGLYFLVGKYSFSHRQNQFDVAAEERVSTQILFKELDPLLTVS